MMDSLKGTIFIIRMRTVTDAIMVVSIVVRFLNLS